MTFYNPETNFGAFGESNVRGGGGVGLGWDVRSASVRLRYAEFLTLALGDKATYGWPKNRPMNSNRYIDANLKSVAPLQIPGAAAAYHLVFTSKNHHPETQVVCVFTDMANSTSDR